MKSAPLPGIIILMMVACTSSVVTAAQVGDPSTPQAPSRHADFKVAIWYRRDHPLDTFQYQVYNVRKGQYTRAVDEWLKQMRTKFTAYEAVVRDIDLAREKGETDSLKVGSVIRRELLAAAALEGVFIGGTAGGPVVSPYPGPGPPSSARRIGRPPVPASGLPGAVGSGPPSAGYPVPVPYPRPHP